MNRRLRAVVPVSLAAALLTLSACGSGEPDPAATATPAPAATTPAEAAGETPTAAATTPATDLQAIQVEGAPGEKPAVSVPAPWGIDETRTQVLTEGDGPAVPEGGTVEVHYVGINGRTGEEFDESFSRGAPATFPLGQVVPGFQKGLTGQRVGSRMLIAMPGRDGYDAAGGSPEAGIQVGDTLIFVVDIISASLPEAQGEPVAPAEGLPTVEFTNGTPEVTIPPNTPAPTEVIVQPLIRSNGRPVGEGDVITAHYQAVRWSDGEVIADTYGGEPEQGPLNRLIPAWREGLTGQPVGSRVMIITPPGQAYPEDPGARTPNPAMGEPLVYVVDILFATAPPAGPPR